NHTTPFSVAEKECEKGSEWLMPFTTNILTISLHQHNLTKSQKNSCSFSFFINTIISFTLLVYIF
ncbi:hypothetical protein, partial [Granulicatella sp. zg-84]|uniref:hypothetical protein n=1 Tax=Granulicatella sp. zg-84 TaxID=2678503 RepID=UPI001966DD30